MVDVNLSVDVARIVPMRVSEGVSATLSFGGEVFSPDVYHGSYTVTPSATEQVLHTAGMALVEDVVVGPIPNNYGLVTWDGSAITIT